MGEDHDEEELRMALRMSMQEQPSSLPEPKRSKPWESSGGGTPPQEEMLAEESEDEKKRRLQRELMAAAAEKRMSMMMKNVKADDVVGTVAGSKADDVVVMKGEDLGEEVPMAEVDLEKSVEDLGEEVPMGEVDQLFSMIFGSHVSKNILAQWTNQGIRFSSDPETAMGLVQHEGGPCGVLAAIQAFVLKYLIFFPDNGAQVSPSNSSGTFESLTEESKKRALIRSMAEILFLCGNNKGVVIATLSVPGYRGDSSEALQNEIIAKQLEGISIESASDLHKILRVQKCTSLASAFETLEGAIPFFQSRMGAILFLISALLSRGLDWIQSDRDDPSLPLVTEPFGHASQEILNLLLCGQAVPNVFDGRMDLGGGMFLMGIPSRVEVGFLTLLEYLNFCKTGQNLKCPKWPIWVVGSESHYTVLFSLHTKVQDENELEERESAIRRAFDAQDQSGGGGFISVEGFHQVLKDASINLPTEKVDHLCGTGFIVWSEFWQVLLDLDKKFGGLKDSTGLMGKRVFELFHFNGIAKSVLNGNQSETPVQRPRITRLKVSVPPSWTPEEFMASGISTTSGKDLEEVSKPEPPPQHAPLVDCIRTRWPRAVCNWDGDAPSIV